MRARPDFREPGDFEPSCTRDGWQHEASSRVERQFRDANLFSRLGDDRVALVRSQGALAQGWYCQLALSAD